MAGLAKVFLRDLELDGLVCLLQAAEQRRHGLANLEIDGTVLDLDNYVVIEFPIK